MLFSTLTAAATSQPRNRFKAIIAKTPAIGFCLLWITRLSCDNRGFPGRPPAGMAYYVQESELPVREDRHNEFKGHKNVAEKDVPPWCKIPYSRRSSQTAASKCVRVA